MPALSKQNTVIDILSIPLLTDMDTEAPSDDGVTAMFPHSGTNYLTQSVSLETHLHSTEF